MIATLDSRIVRDPDIVGGQPRIAGRRVTVKDIVIRHELLGHCPDTISEDYDLSLVDIFTALAYYYAHQEEIDRAIKNTDEFIESLKTENPSKIRHSLSD